MTEGLTGVGFSLYKLNNTEPNVYDTFGFMTIDIPETKTLKQYLRDLNLILKINSSTLKLVESKLSGFSAMNATWIERNNKVEMIYTILDKTVYILQFLTVESSNRITFFVDTSAIELAEVFADNTGLALNSGASWGSLYLSRESMGHG